MTEDDLKFIYHQEYWFLSAFYNSEKMDINVEVAEIQKLIDDKVKNLTKDDLGKISYNPDLQKKIIELGKNMSIKVDWVDYIESFFYFDENEGIEFDTLGYFQFEVEYYKGNDKKKKEIEPMYLQQIPGVILEELKKFTILIENEYMVLDEESPIYVYSISKETTPKEIEWTTANIEKYKKVLGQYTELYSGQWPDYSDELYSSRTQGNLSNRISELHMLGRNSGFIYMKAENYKMFFNGYMKTFVLKPTAQIRAMVFALMSIIQSLETLYVQENYAKSKDVPRLEKKIHDLKTLRGMLNTNLSIIYNELDYNRRQHYTAVLKHLISVFNLNGILDRFKDKFEIIFDTMEDIYREENEKQSKRSNKVMELVGFLLSTGIFIDLLDLFSNFISSEIFLKGFAIVSTFLLLGLIGYIIEEIVQMQLEKRRAKDNNTVDAIIFDDQDRVLLITRKYPPFKSRFAFPGGFIDNKELPENAVIREVEEETNLKVRVVKKVGVYDKEGRDPRGKVISNAYICEVIDGKYDELEHGDDAAGAQFIPLKDIEKVNLAFDHEWILKDAIKMR